MIKNVNKMNIYIIKSLNINSLIAGLIILKRKKKKKEKHKLDNFLITSTSRVFSNVTRRYQT